MCFTKCQQLPFHAYPSHEHVDRTQPWDTIYEPRTLSSPHDYGVPSLRVSPDGILNFSRLAAPVAAKTKLHVVGGASGFRLLVE